MSRTGNCYDNAVMESFFGTLKTELVHHEAYATREEARQSLFEYIEVFYNRQRRYSALRLQKSPRIRGLSQLTPASAHGTWGRSIAIVASSPLAYFSAIKLVRDCNHRRNDDQPGEDR